jgi:hypothetical protein
LPEYACSNCQVLVPEASIQNSYSGYVQPVVLPVNETVVPAGDGDLGVADIVGVAQVDLGFRA